MTIRPITFFFFTIITLSLLLAAAWWYSVQFVPRGPFAEKHKAYVQDIVNKALADYEAKNRKQTDDVIQKQSAEMAQINQKLTEKQAASTEVKTEQQPGMTEEKVQAIVQDFILKNPKVIEQAFLKLREQQAEDQQKLQEKALTEKSQELFNSGHDYVGGNPNGDVTVVEFFDYNCGYCRKAFDDLAKLIENDKNVRVVLKELPIFGEESDAAARGALAALKQGKYFEFHRDMMKEPGKADEAKSLRLAEKLGLDMAKFKADMQSDDVKTAIRKNQEVSQQIGLEGTPLYIVGKQIIPGAPEDLYDQFVAKIKAAREKTQ